MGGNGADDKASNEGWVGDAWREHLNGVSIYAIAKKHGKRWHTVRDNLKRHAANRAAELREGIDPTANYIDGLEEDLRAASRLMLEVQQDTAQVGALKLRVDIRKLIAGGMGVSTEKTTQDLNVNGKLSGLGDMPQEERDELARLAAKASNGKAP